MPRFCLLQTLPSLLLWAGLANAATPAGTACSVLDATTLEQQAGIFLQERGGLEKVEAEVIGAVPAVTAVHWTLKSAWPASRVALEVRGPDCAGVLQTRLVWFKARALKSAWVYGRSGGMDTALAETRPVRQPIDMAQWRLPAAELVAEPGGEYLAHAVKAGAPLRRSDLKAAPLVRRDDVVVVVVQGRGVQLRTRAMAMQVGAQGDWIAVLIDGAEKSTRARVVAPGVVHVDI